MSRVLPSAVRQATAIRPPSAGRLSCHHTAEPATVGNDRPTRPRAMTAPLMGDGHSPYRAVSAEAIAIPAIMPCLPARRGGRPYPGRVTAAGRTYQIRTYGCQMNAHDSERLAGLLDEAGYRPARPGETPDVVVFNTCAVRENAADRLYGNLGHLLPQKKRSGMQIAVGGCLAQMERAAILRRAPWVDVVYGTHNMAALPALLERARARRQAQAEFADTLTEFPSLLPARRGCAYSAWVAISVGCNNTCTFCIVPSLRGRERDRRPGDILAEIRALA